MLGIAEVVTIPFAIGEEHRINNRVSYWTNHNIKAMNKGYSTCFVSVLKDKQCLFGCSSFELFDLDIGW